MYQTGNGKFKIVSSFNSAEVVLIEELDREVTDSYTLVIEVSLVDKMS